MEGYLYMNTEARAEKWSKRHCCIVNDPARGPFLVARKRLEDNYRAHNENLLDVLPHAASVVKLSNYTLTLEKDASDGGVIKLRDASQQGNDGLDGLAMVEVRDKSRENVTKWGAAIQAAQHAHTHKKTERQNLGRSKEKETSSTVTAAAADKENAPVNSQRQGISAATAGAGAAIPKGLSRQVQVLGVRPANKGLIEQRGLAGSALGQSNKSLNVARVQETQAHLRAHGASTSATHKPQAQGKDRKCVVFEGGVTATTAAHASVVGGGNKEAEEASASLKRKAECIAVEVAARRRELLLAQKDEETEKLRRGAIDRKAAAWALLMVLCMLGGFTGLCLDLQLPAEPAGSLLALGAPPQPLLDAYVPSTAPGASAMLALPGPALAAVPVVSLQVRLVSAELLRFQRAYHGPLPEQQPQLGHITIETSAHAIQAINSNSLVKVVTRAQKDEEAAWRQVEARQRALVKVQEQERALKIARLARQQAAAEASALAELKAAEQAAVMEKQEREVLLNAPRKRAELNAKVIEKLTKPFRAIYNGMQNIDLQPLPPAF